MFKLQLLKWENKVDAIMKRRGLMNECHTESHFDSAFCNIHF